MTAFIDATVLIYSAIRDERREACNAILRAVARGGFEARTSTAALEEVWHFELSGKEDITGTVEQALTLFRPLLPVTDEIFAIARGLPVKAMGANDRLHAATCLANGIDTIVTSDTDFDALEAPRRLDPLDAARELRDSSLRGSVTYRGDDEELVDESMGPWDMETE